MLRHRLSLREFQALLERASEGVRLELLDGEVHEMAPGGSGHAGLVTYLTKRLEGLYGDRALVSVQNPLRHAPAGPGLPQTPGADVLLEVAHFSLAKDREVRLPLYALAGIPEVWPFTEEGAMGVYREPGEETAPLALGAPPFRWEPPTGTPPA